MPRCSGDWQLHQNVCIRDKRQQSQASRIKGDQSEIKAAPSCISLPVFFRPSPLTSALIPQASLIIHMQIIPHWQLCHSRGALLDSPLFFLFLPSTFLFIENEVLQLCINIVFQSHQLSVSETEIKKKNNNAH